MNPKHNNPIRPNRVAHAPYNFVPLPERAVTVNENEIPGHDIYEHLCGYIECGLTTEAPTYTRCAMDREFFHRWADRIREMMQNDQARAEYAEFFHLDDAKRPVIPGSSLRGMVRALVEIAGCGKMQWVTDEPLVFRAVGDTSSLGRYYRGHLLQDDEKKRYTPLVRAGYLEKRQGIWVIRPAQVIGSTTFARIYIDKIPENLDRWHGCKNAYRIWVKLGCYDYQKVRGGFIHLKYAPVLKAVNSDAEDFQEAVLAYSGSMSSKRQEAVIFPPDPNASLIEVDDELVRIYREQISQEQKNLLGENGALNPHQPIFYLVENGRLVFFGHVMMFRLPYVQSPLDLVPDALRCENDIDLAEAIFGYTLEGSREKARAGRVRFTDARFESTQNGVWLSQEPITPGILSGPKPTTFQHYLTQQQPDEVESGRTYKDGTPKMELRLGHYASPPPHETVIRGHKLYWHKRDQLAPEDFAEREQVDWSTDTQHTQIKLVRAGVTFRFRVYFESLREWELGALLWALTLPGEPGKVYRHKIGMGKPLGLGSVRISPKLHLSNRQSRYQRLFDGKRWHAAESPISEEERFVEAFEGYVLEKMDRQERGSAQSLKDLERIRMLLKMLEWPGPDRSLTMYMVIEPTNEYKERPVLPDPLHVGGETLQTSERHTGRVKWFSDEKGYGFIQVDKSSQEVFVHHSGIEGEGFRTLGEGDRVEFSIEKASKGPKAINVRVMGANL